MLVVRRRGNVKGVPGNVYLNRMVGTTWVADIDRATRFADFPAALTAMQPFLAGGMRCDARPSDPTVKVAEVWEHDELLAPRKEVYVIRVLERRGDAAAYRFVAPTPKDAQLAFTDRLDEAAPFRSIMTALEFAAGYLRDDARWDVAPAHDMDRVQPLWAHDPRHRVAPPAPSAPDLAIVLEGGAVNRVISDDKHLHGAKVTVVDLDFDAAAPDDVRRFTNDDGSTFEAACFDHHEVVAADFAYSVPEPVAESDGPTP